MRGAEGSDWNGAGAPPRLASGTTTLGIVCRDGVVLATEHRATMGHFIANKSTVKLFRIDRHLGATFAGSLGDAQAVIRSLRAEVTLAGMRRGEPMSVASAATWLSNFLNTHRFSPYFAWLILGGVDRSGGHVFAVDADGAAVEDRFVSVGSGSPFVYGILEDRAPGNPTLAEGVDLALRGLASAMQRDSASGDGYAVAEVTRDGYRELEADETRRRLARLRLE